MKFLTSHINNMVDETIDIQDISDYLHNLGHEN